jgi:flagellar basal-body rod protein FlgB
MIEALFNQPNYVGAKKMLDATVLRHTALASNIANLETPHYQRVDLASNFQSELQRATASKDTGRIASLKPSLAVDTDAVPHGRDGNTVNLETELLELSQNTLQHTLETQLVTGSLLKLRLAITGKTA